MQEWQKPDCFGQGHRKPTLAGQAINVLIQSLLYVLSCHFTMYIMFKHLLFATTTTKKKKTLLKMTPKQRTNL